jgi:hypothetical protein
MNVIKLHLMLGNLFKLGRYPPCLEVAKHWVKYMCHVGNIIAWEQLCRKCRCLDDKLLLT